MRAKPKLYPHYCYTKNGKVKVKHEKPIDFEDLENMKIVNAPNETVATQSYRADLRNGTI